MANQIFGRKFHKMPDSYQDKMTENYGDQAEAEHKARGEAQIRARDLTPKEWQNIYKVKDGNFDEFVTSGNSRLGGAGGAGNRSNEGSGVEGDKAGRGKNRVSSADFANLYKSNLKENATRADKVQLKKDLIDWGRAISPEFEKDNIASVEAAGYGGGVEKRFANWQKRIDAWDKEQANKDKPKPEKPPSTSAKPPQNIETPEGVGGSNNSPGLAANQQNPQSVDVQGRNNKVNTYQDNSISQITDNSQFFGGDDRTLNIYRGESGNKDYPWSDPDDIYANQADYEPKANYANDYSDATMAGFFQPSDSPSASQKFLNKYMTGMRGEADNFSDSLTNLKRNYADNLAMVDYGQAQKRMNELTDKYENRAELNRLQSQPTAASGFKGLEMGSLPEKVEDETEEIYGSFK